MKFFKRKQKFETFEYFIPEEHIEKFYELRDVYYSRPIGQDRVAKYKFWRYIFDLFPQVHIKDDCELEYSHVLKPSLIVRKAL